MYYYKDLLNGPGTQLTTPMVCDSREVVYNFVHPDEYQIGGNYPNNHIRLRMLHGLGPYMWQISGLVLTAGP